MLLKAILLGDPITVVYIQEIRNNRNAVVAPFNIG